MNRKTAKDLLPIIKAFSEGKCVETKTSSGWISIENMGFVGILNNTASNQSLSIAHSRTQKSAGKNY